MNEYKLIMTHQQRCMHLLILVHKSVLYYSLRSVVASARSIVVTGPCMHTFADVSLLFNKSEFITVGHVDMHLLIF